MTEDTDSKSESVNRGLNAAVKRRRVMDIDSLRGQVETLQQCCVDFSAALDVAKEFGLTELVVDGVTKYDRTLSNLISYITNIRTSISKVTVGSVPGKTTKKKR